ncbi:MAG TPA: hypothetical protein VF698_13105 [Thermoanaerobaculia bacterium]|jgi:hypothetical protein
MTETNETVVVATNADEKKPWVTPAATVEQVSEVTKITGGGSGDGTSCHT